MEKQTTARKFFSWNTLWVVLISCIVNACVWIGFHGIPLMGLPRKEAVESITLLYNGTEERTVTDKEKVELLVKSANLLNYQLRKAALSSPLRTFLRMGNLSVLRQTLLPCGGRANPMH